MKNVGTRPAWLPKIILCAAFALSCSAIAWFGMASGTAQANQTAQAPSGVPGIACWGDSLTAGSGGNGTSYPSVLEQRLEEGGYSIPVVNLGIGGENTKEILSRAGALSIVLTEPATIPAKPGPVEIKFQASDGSEIKLLRRGSRGMESVSLAGVKGTVSIEQKKASSKKYRYFFTRDSAGKQVKAEAGTRIVNSGSYLYADWIPVLLMGQNGGWNDDPDELIRQQRMLVDTLKLNKGRFLILGLTTGSSESRAALDAAMDAQWGWQYLNLRSYLSSPDTLEKYGLAITESDAALIAQGIVPACLRTGEVHLNATGYRAVGDLVYQALVNMGYLEK